MKKSLLIVQFYICSVIMRIGRFKTDRQAKNQTETMENNYQVKLITVDPGHFHAALVQKRMYDQVSPDVHVYAPEGPDVPATSEQDYIIQQEHAILPHGMR